MQRIWIAVLIVAVVLGFTHTANAQDNVYPLEFEYEDDAGEYYAAADIAVQTGDRLQATIQGGEDIYFFIYTDDENLYEGESLDEFVAPFDGIVYLDVLSHTQARGRVTVISAGNDTAINQGNTTENSAANTIAPSGNFSTVPCPFNVPPEVNVTCGVLTVPENRQVANSGTIHLAVAIVPALSANPLPDPIFYLEGGPGGSALVGIDSWYTSPYREQRTIILLEQRGTGFSEPSLNCSEMDNESEDELGQVEACRDRLLAEGIDLTAYNSRENAADVEALRQALGYDQVNLYGISYGTRLALTVMRDYPAGLRAVVLDSVYPPNIDTNYTASADTYQLISTMFADCAAQSACAQAFPNLEQRFYDALDQISADLPLVTDPESGDQYNLFPEDVINTLYDQLQDTGLIDAIPASLGALASGDYDLYLELAMFGSGVGDGASADAVGLAQELALELYPEELEDINQWAAQGDTAAIAALLSELFDLTSEETQIAAEGFVQIASGETGSVVVSAVEPPDIDDDSEGMNLSVQCYEEMPFMTLEEAEARANAVAMPEIVREATFAGSSSEFEQCAVWPAGTASAVENAPVVSAVPTLVLAARYDTATPPWWADLAAETLSNSYTYHFPMVGHGVIDGGPCPVGIGLDFLADPLTAPDAACIATMDTQFYIP
ncbi:MAG: alpha/beta fold hydrolase [Anaerolineae bacterium]|nr:alpha/beta fold hydrolase [Anaerolineae bacterium]